MMVRDPQTLDNFLAEPKRRKVLRVGIYLVNAWLFLH
jgi:hypothetical protein